MEESDLKHLDFFKQKAKKLKQCYSKFSEDKLISTRMMFEVTKTIEFNFEEKMALDGLVAACWPVLIMAYSAEGQKIIAADICSALTQNKSTTSRVIDSLIDKGFLKREADNQDRRKIYIYISEEGKQYVEKLLPMYSNFQTELFEGVDLQILQEQLFKMWINVKRIKEKEKQ